ncbi:MAG: alpha/beta hydrolase [Planctomycetales bacterium]
MFDKIIPLHYYRLFLLLLFAFQVSVGQAEDPAKSDKDQPSDIQISTHDNSTNSLTRITVPVQDGQVAWADVLKGLARAKQLDDTALEGMLPDGSFGVHGFAARLTLVVLNRGLDPHIHLKVLDRETEDQRLQVTLDNQAMRASVRDFKQMLKGMLIGDKPAPDYGLEFDANWSDTPATKELVVIVHGYNSAPDELQLFARPAREAGLPCAWLRYPNDQPLSTSAQLLSKQLKELAERHPQRRVALLTHSMGGLIARQCIESEQLNPGNVDRLIMVAPPNGGSILAHLATAIDLYEHLKENDSLTDIISHSIDRVHDGLNEARQDLEPGSQHMKDLAGLQRNPQVRYTILLGTRAPASRQQLDTVREVVRNASEKHRLAKLFGPKLDGWLADMEEVIDGKGDGMVAIKRGRLEGVDDTVLLPFGHLLSDPESDGVRQLQKEIGDRLRVPIKPPIDTKKVR